MHSCMVQGVTSTRHVNLPGSCWNRFDRVVALRSERYFRLSVFQKMSICHSIFNPRTLRLSRFCCRRKHDIARKLFEEVNLFDPPNVSDPSKLIKKVKTLVGYDEFHDALRNDEQFKEFDDGVKNEEKGFDISLVCKRFPSIILGSSPPLLLYADDETPSETAKTVVSDAQSKVLPDNVATKLEDSVEFNRIFPSDGSAELMFEDGMSKESVNARERSADNERTCSQFDDAFSQAEKRSDIDTVMESNLGTALLDEPLTCFPFIKKRQRHLMEKYEFHTVRKLMHHFPRVYADLQNARAGISDGQYVASVGEVASSKGIRVGLSFSFVEVVVSCKAKDDGNKVSNSKRNETIYLHLKRYFRGARYTNQFFLTFLESKFDVGDVVYVSGKVKPMSSNNRYELRDYTIDIIKNAEDMSSVNVAKPYPIYPARGRLNPDFLRSTISRAALMLPSNIDPMPDPIVRKFGLLTLSDAYKKIHCPNTMDEADLARKRLVFDEYFYVQLGRLYQLLDGVVSNEDKKCLLEKYNDPELNLVKSEEWSLLTKKCFQSLPYTLTGSQLRAISEIIWDLKRSTPMNRLLQGDVGCGKTVVALLACLEVIASGYQAAFMVPTELLAIQHYESFQKMLDRLDDHTLKPSVVLLTGSTSTKETRMIREDVKSGAISMVIGTHSLISDKLEFPNLRLAVVDEQHLFGVIQRGKFNSKLYCNSKVEASENDDAYMAPHILAMSATPIPRTLALALYGDMSLTQITELPPGRIPVETVIVEGTSEGLDEIYKMMSEDLESGGRVYVVYPIIDQSEHLPQLRAASTDFETMSHRFKSCPCKLLHGRMKACDKDEALRSFRCGESRILLATQIIEIGVDVPEASMMVVMNAERFGIAQLHQLRGRVGRGTRRSKCVLVSANATSMDRLRYLERSADGFYLANMDLLLRGPGDLLGKRQSGHLPEFPIARLEMYGDILQDARAAALEVLGDSNDLGDFPDLKAELSMRQPLCLLGD